VPRHAKYVPRGVIPAVLLPFADDLTIDERSFRKHLSDVAATAGLSAITVNAHSTEVASCTFDEQRRVLEIARDEIERAEIDRIRAALVEAGLLGAKANRDAA
jgi:4-hydroxy-tetrahydrodipicolinate synthase